MKWLDTAWWKGLETIIGLECPVEADGYYRVLRIQKDQHRIKIQAQQILNSVDEALSYLEKFEKLPIVLVLAPDFVMERLLPQDAGADLVSAVLGVSVEDRDDFEILRFPGIDNSYLTALIRKDSIESNLEKLGTHRQRVITAIFSPAVCSIAMPAVQKDFVANNVVINLREKQYAFIEGRFAEKSALRHLNFSEHDENTIGTALQIPADFVYLYSSMLYVWLHARNSKASLPLQKVWNTYLETSLLKQIAVTSALILGVWFLCLFSFRIQAEREKAELEAQYSQNLPVLNAIRQLDEKIAAREDLGNQLSAQTLKPSKAAFFLDQIAFQVPKEVRLLSMTVAPEEEDFKRQGLDDDPNIGIIVRGESPKSAPIASFSEALELIPSIKTLSVKKSELNFQSNMYEFIFLLDITGINNEGNS